MRFKPSFIRMPLHKMAGCPWNLLDDCGVRVAWCGTDGNHEKDGELIANDILNLIAIGEAVDDLHQDVLKRDADHEVQLATANKRIEELGAELATTRKALEQAIKIGAVDFRTHWAAGGMVYDYDHITSPYVEYQLGFKSENNPELAAYLKAQGETP